MTEATLKNKKKKQAHNNRVSAETPYTEYSWESLTDRRQDTARNGHQPMNSAAAVSRTGAGVHPSGNTASFGRVPTANGKSAAQGSSVPTRVGARTGTSASAKNKFGTGTAVKKKTDKLAKVKTKVEYLTTDVEASRRYSFPLSLVLLAICGTVLIMAIITTGVQINEITTENSNLKTQYNQLVKQENELSLLLETRDDLRVVEAMAKEELGMVKKDQVDRYYLTVHKEDKIEIIEAVEEEKASVFDDLKEFGSSVLDRILGFFGM